MKSRTKTEERSLSGAGAAARRMPPTPLHLARRLQLHLARRPQLHLARRPQLLQFRP
jgi:hypothetical protein